MDDKLIIQFDVNKTEGEFIDAHFQQIMDITGMSIDGVQQLLFAIEEYGTRCYNLGAYGI